MSSQDAAAMGHQSRSLALTPENRGKVGILLFLCSEVAFFGTLITAYITYLGADQEGPTPEVLSFRLVIPNSICLLSSSITVVMALRALVRGAKGAFLGWTFLTVALGLEFLIGTGFEWAALIRDHELTIARNLFGTTFYTLIGFHGFHVTVGLICLTLMLCLGLAGKITTKNAVSFEIVSWYWHFVDGVWIFIFTLVYVIGR